MRRRLLIWIFMLFLLVGSVSAFRVNYFHYKINLDDCRLVLESIPQRYYQGVRAVNFYIYPNLIAGSYVWNGQVINVYDNCSLTTLIHELAHHKNKMDGIDKFHSFNHRVGFRVAEMEIWQNLN